MPKKITKPDNKKQQKSATANSATQARHENMSPTASLLFSCKDGVGVIAALANFFTERDLNISRYEEFTDDGQFFSRCEWQLNDRWDSETEFSQEFSNIAEVYDGWYEVKFMNRKQSLGLFVSKQPHALIEVLNKVEANFFPAVEVSFIVGNDESMRMVADRHGVPFFYIPTSANGQGDALEYEAQQLEIIHRYQPDFVGLARYMKVLSANFIQQAACPIINIHHSFLPSFVGGTPYTMAYERGVKLIGATSHFVTAELDQGPIIEQDVLRVKPGSSTQDMIRMGSDIEQSVFANALQKVLEHKAIIYKNRTIIFN